MRNGSLRSCTVRQNDLTAWQHPVNCRPLEVVTISGGPQARVCMERVMGFEPTKWQLGKLLPYRLATPALDV